MSYPEIYFKDFDEVLNDKYEIKSNNQDNKRDYLLLEPSQILTGNYLSETTPYNSLLLFHETGTGKTLSAINVIQNNPGMNVYILTKNKTIKQNFRNEIDFFKQFNTENGIDNFENPLNYISYGSFVNRVLGMKKKQTRIVEGKVKNISKRTLGNERISDLNNSLIIVDEVHNIINNDGYIALKKVLDKSTNYKLLLLSATPVFDNIREAFEIANLLNSESDFPIREDLVKTSLVVKINANTGGLLTSSILSITKNGEKELTKSLKGRISYLRTDPKTFPRNTEQGDLIKTDSKLKVVKTKMSKFQYGGYLEALKTDTSGKSEEDSYENVKSSSLFKNSTDASTIIYPNGKFGKDGFQGTTNFNFLKRDTLKEFSSKIHELLVNIDKSNGPVIVYTQFVNNGGTELLKKVFQVNGYKYIVMDDSVEPVKREKLRLKFNDIKNKNGDVIKVLIGSPVIEEGLTFKRVRQIHILEPSWNLSRIQQVEGRGIRNNSHEGLEEKDKNVDVFKYTSIYPNGSVSFIDQDKYILSEEKDKQTKQIERIMKKVSIDCIPNRKRNILVKSLDFSRRCDYSECDYKCPTEDSSKTDYSTNSYFLRKREIQYISFNIRKLFENKIIYSLEDISSHFKKIKNKDNIYEAIQVLLDSGEIRYISDSINQSFYYKSENVPDSIYELGGNELPLGVDKNIKDYLESKGKNTQSKKKRVSIKPQEDLEFNEKVYGTTRDKFGVSDGKFRIVDNRKQTQNVKDKRKINLGKVCSTYKKEELLELSEYLGVQMESLSKNEMCENLKNYLNDKNLLIN